MKLLLLLFLALLMVLVFLYCCKKLGVDVGDLMKRTSNEPQQQLPHVPIPLYETYGIQYKLIGNMVWYCLKTLKINEFDISSNIIATIFCRKLYDRVRVYSKNLTFYYEIPLAVSSGIQDGKIRVADFDRKKIEEILRENLPEYMCDGFLYSSVHVYSGEGNYGIIELYGVGRSQPSVEGIII